MPRFTSDLTIQGVFLSTTSRQAAVFSMIVSLKAIILNGAWSGCGAQRHHSGRCSLVKVLATRKVRNLLADLYVLTDLKGGVFSTRCLLLKGEDDILDSSSRQAFG
jgi:hypothetical protein